MQAWMKSCQVCDQHPRLPFHVLAEMEAIAVPWSELRPRNRQQLCCTALELGSSMPWLDKAVVRVGIEWIAAHYPVEWALAVMDDPVTEPCGEAAR